MRPKSDYLLAAVVVAVSTGIAVTLRSRLTLTDLAMIYLLGNIGISMRSSPQVAIPASLLSVTSFYYFCVPFFDSFVLSDSGYISTLLAMLAVSLVISTLTAGIRLEAAAAQDAEVRIQTERMNRSLLSAVSHDLKTPLASIYGAATSLLEQGERMESSHRRQLAESIAGEAERLNREVSNLLEMTRLDSGVEVRKDWQSVEEIVGAALNRTDKALSTHPIETYIPAGLPLIRVDDVLIEHALINLLENISKYTPPDSAIEITAVHNGELVIISIEDRGPGFAPGGAERGGGPGLAICRAIVHAHEGTIHAENRKDGGALVRIELPVGGDQPQVLEEFR